MRLLATTAVLLGCTTFASPQKVSQPSGSQPPAFSALPLTVPSPADNPSTPQKVALGRLLFWDPILSGSQDIACATCHHPSFGYTDGRDLPIGTGGRGMGPARTFPNGATPLVKRNSQTILNVGFNGVDVWGHVDPAQAPMFWDSRARSLEAQALVPIESLEEMRGEGSRAEQGVAGAIARVNRITRYRQLFAAAFGADRPITPANLSRAIAAYERSLVTTDTPFDRYMRGDRTALNANELRGMDAFESHGCTLCHNGPMLSDYKVHVIGFFDNPRLGDHDRGAEGRYAFRTPSLRNLGYTKPYMHSGVMQDLGSVVGFYRIVGGGAPQLLHFDKPRRTDNGHVILGSPVGRDQLDPLLRQVSVEGDVDDIVAFLGTLNGTFDRSIPERVPSGLRPGGR